MVKAGIFDFENENREHFLWVYNMRNRKKTDIKNGIERLLFDTKYCNQLEKNIYEDSKQFDIKIRANKIINFICITMELDNDKK